MRRTQALHKLLRHSGGIVLVNLDELGGAHAAMLTRAMGWFNIHCHVRADLDPWCHRKNRSVNWHQNAAP